MRLLAAFALATGFWISPAAAQTKAVVVELFTSQGCSSCPPADEFMHQLAARDDVVALALHVDYWDYIGWKDSFANPAHADRQRAYAAANNRRMIYTPQMVINGSEHVVGNSPTDVTDMINRHLQTPATINMQANRDGGEVHVKAEPLGDIGGPFVVQLVQFMPEKTVKITRGENAGRTISYANVVTSMAQVGTWDGSEPLDLAVAVETDGPVAILIQRRGGTGLVEAAARLD